MEIKTTYDLTFTEEEKNASIIISKLLRTIKNAGISHEVCKAVFQCFWEKNRGELTVLEDIVDGITGAKHLLDDMAEFIDTLTDISKA